MAAPIIVNIFVTSADEVMSIPLKDWARKIGKSPSTLRAWCEEGKVPGAEKRGNSWYINPIINAITSAQTTHGVTSSSDGPKSKRGGNVRNTPGRDVSPGPEGSPEAGPGGRSEIDI